MTQNQIKWIIRIPLTIILSPILIGGIIVLETLSCIRWVFSDLSFKEAQWYNW
jgi:hypothetical protein